jgi:hypothetical protein
MAVNSALKLIEMEQQEHQLKILPKYFNKVFSGIKTFEVRFNDRDFQTGDKVSLNEYADTKTKYTGNQIDVVITYLLTDSVDGISKGYCVFGFVKL